MSVTVVVLNRDRRTELICCLRALHQQSYRDFEVVVVTNQPDVVTREMPYADRSIVVPFPDANVSAARNAGIQAAHGQIIAFCDDDAVPEPSWIENLLAGFDDPKVGGVGGLVRGRNGVSVQWGAQEVDQFGNDWPLGDIKTAKSCLKTAGTNCAFRRDALQSVGGFDQSYRYFLDETDLNWRLMDAGWSLKYLPDAEVHHSYAQNGSRTSERVPRDLFEIGASKAYFCKRFGDPDRIAEELDGFRRVQRSRLIKAMHLGLIEPAQVRPVLNGLEDGISAGKQKEPVLAKFPDVDNSCAKPFCDGHAPKTVVLSYGLLRRRAGRRAAEEHAAKGAVVTLLEYSWTALMLRVWYDPLGYWHHRGGIFGRMRRDDVLFRLRNPTIWIREESNRIRRQRRL